MGFYKKRCKHTEAYQFKGTFQSAINIARKIGEKAIIDNDGELYIVSKRIGARPCTGDYIVKKSSGHVYIMSSDEFKSKYIVDEEKEEIEDLSDEMPC